jgi:hypothetical protein
MLKRLAVASLAVATALPLGAAELAGVTFPGTITVDGTSLQLNGLGLRKKAIFKVYVGALYLQEKSSEPSAILAKDEARQMVMHFVRNVGSGKIVDAWKEGFQANAPEAAATLSSEIQQFCAWWTDLKDGEAAVMTYLPGKGTTLEIGGNELGTIPGKPFADLLLSVWVGPDPPGSSFKEGILGK